jgi:hypothetical protein
MAAMARLELPPLQICLNLGLDFRGEHGLGLASFHVLRFGMPACHLLRLDLGFYFRRKAGLSILQLAVHGVRGLLRMHGCMAGV